MPSQRESSELLPQIMMASRSFEREKLELNVPRSSWTAVVIGMVLS